MIFLVFKLSLYEGRSYLQVFLTIFRFKETSTIGNQVEKMVSRFNPE